MLALRGVIESAERPEDDANAGLDDGALLETLEAALAELVRERQAEGAQLATALTERIEEIAALTRIVPRRWCRRARRPSARGCVSRWRH